MPTPAITPPRRPPLLARLVGLRFALLTAAALLPAAAADWPEFLGPHRNNSSPETGLVDRWSTNGPPLVWSRPVGTGYSAPSVRGSLLVLHHRIRNEEIVECFDAATGTPRWRHATPTQYEDPYGYNNGPRCTPLLTTNRCYTFGAEGRLSCLDLETGRRLWERETARDWNIPPAFFGVGSSPILEADRLIVMVGGQPDSGMVAFDPATGKTLWESVGKQTWNGQSTIGWPADREYVWRGTEKLASYSTPTVATIHGQRHLLCLMRQGLVSLDPASGSLRFSRWFQSHVNDSVNAITPVVVGDRIFISAAYYRVGSVVLQVQPDGRSFTETWRSPKHPRELDPATGRPSQPILELHWTTPVYHDGHLYAFSGRNEPDARFRCVEFLSGRLRWDRDESWPPHSSRQPSAYGRGSAIVADGKLIVLGEGGLLGLFRVNPEKPEELARWQVPQLQYPAWAGPVLSQRRLYLRGENALVCLNLAAPPPAP